ncbi:MAG: site-specific integrase [Devosia sp.]
MATIRKRGNRFQVQVRRQDRPAISRSFIRLNDAKEWARTIETEADRQGLVADRAPLRRLTLGDVLIRYRDEVAARQKSAATEIVLLNAFLRHPICLKSLASLAASDFSRYRDERLTVVAPTTVKREFNTVRRMFNVARDDWGLPLAENPVSRVRLVALDNRRERRLRAGEYERLMASAATRRQPLIAPIIVLAIETAMRRGEMLAMRWDHLDLERGQVTIPHTKTGRPRTIPLTAMAVSTMASLPRTEDRIFPITPNALRLSWSRVVKAAGVEDLHFHDLRHEAISRFFELGLTLPEVAAISGHRDVRMLLRYAHASPEELAKKLERMPG